MYFSEKIKILLSIVLLAAIFFWIDVKTTSSCLYGFPLAYGTKCFDYPVRGSNSLVFNFIIDVIFWTTFATGIVLAWSKVKNQLASWRSRLLQALVLVAGTFARNIGCSGIICIGDGRGLPLAYFSRWLDFRPISFVIDILFWFLVLLFFFFIKRMLGKLKRFKKYRAND